jgi:hypothetical protein
MKAAYVLSILLFCKLSLTSWVCGQEGRTTRFDIGNGHCVSLDECPPPVQRFFEHMECSRWRPESKQWKKDTIDYDKKNALIWTREKGKASKMVARTVFERPPLRVGNHFVKKPAYISLIANKQAIFL